MCILIILKSSIDNIARGGVAQVGFLVAIKLRSWVVGFNLLLHDPAEECVGEHWECVRD